MTRIFTVLFLLVGAATFAREATSQEADSARTSEVTKRGHGPEETLNILGKRLSLSDEQKAKILPILIERRRKVQEVWATSELFVPQKQVQERGINKESDRRINALLNGDQQKAYLAWQQERKLQRRLMRVQSANSS